MEIKINIPDELLSSSADGLKTLAIQIDRNFKSNKTGKEFIEEFYTMLWEAGYEANEVNKIKAAARQAIAEKKKEFKK